MAIQYLGLSANSWHVMIDSWWDRMIAGILLASLVCGLSYITYRIALVLRRRWATRHETNVVPGAIARHITTLRKSSQRLSHRDLEKRGDELKSFGVFLGSFSAQPTPSERRLLTQWDVLVLDPLREGVRDAAALHSSSQHRIARLDVSALSSSESSSTNEEVIKCLEAVSQTIVRHLQEREAEQAAFTGVLLAEFITHFQPAVLNEVVAYIKALGLDVWVELSPPEYLSHTQARDIHFKSIRGIVYRNASIRPDGEVQNYFQMSAMRSVQRLVAAQRVPHGPPMMTWETVDDECIPRREMYATLMRSFNWCRFNSALSWIGSASALTDSEAAANQTILAKPLGALMWLKDEQNMQAHDFWRVNEQISTSSCNNDDLYDTISDFIPNLAEKLQLSPNEKDGEPRSSQLGLRHARVIERIGQSSLQSCDGNDGYNESENATIVQDPLSTNIDGRFLTGLGCFHLGLDVSPKAYGDVLQTQRNLREHNLLRPISAEELESVQRQVQALVSHHDSDLFFDTTIQAVRELSEYLSTVGDEEPRIQVFAGLHSGFQANAKIQFWGVFDIDAFNGNISIYISNRTLDREGLAGTILHTFLSSRYCARSQCFMAEHLMSKSMNQLNAQWQLPDRLVHDLESLSPEETILFCRRLMFVDEKDDSVVLQNMRICCEHMLLDVPTLEQIRKQNALAYMQGEISVETLISNRLDWLQDKGCATPSMVEAVTLFRQVDEGLYPMLLTGQSETYARISALVQKLCQKANMDAGADIVVLALFCAFRKYAMDEIILEVMDRNVYPNHATDQAGCFAESFALGSRAESFFDITPRAIGRIVSKRTRAYYKKHQPPARKEGFTELPTAYAAMRVDDDPEQGKEEVPGYYQMTFLGIFAIPALIDIMMLTIIGRGLYLTTYMTSEQKSMATLALMIALLFCGAFGAWITSGGSYYFYASAFPAMNMFVLTRFIAGIAFALVGGLIAMVTILIVKGWVAGLIFMYYFMMLTTYLLTLSALSIYQMPGSAFQSGRTVILCCIPILFISPVLTIFIQHDIIVYLCVLTTFLISLLVCARRCISQWSSWYLHIPAIKDAEIVQWFSSRQRPDVPVGALIKDTASEEEIMTEARETFHAAVLKEVERSFWQQSTKDPLVKKMADGYHSTYFLMRWYCRHKRASVPLAYSTTWNLTLNAGTENFLNMQKGLRVHSAFLHWRHTGMDIWSGLLYFVVALQDKWTALLSGGNLVGLSLDSSKTFNLAVGFGLCYYLIGAVCLDCVSQPLWTAANQRVVQQITSLEFLRQATKNDKSARQTLYWKNLAKFFVLHVCGVVVTSALLWVFNATRDGSIMYVAYLGAYSGLLWYQYNKIYCGNDAAISLMIATVVGFPVGLVLHIHYSHFAFGGVIGLAAGTWTAALHSMYIAKIGWPNWLKLGSKKESNFVEVVDKEDPPPKYSVVSLEAQTDFSQSTLARIYDSASAISADEKTILDHAKHPGVRITEIIDTKSCSERSRLVSEAFSSAEEIFAAVQRVWKSGDLTVEIVASSAIAQPSHKIRSITRVQGSKLHLLVALSRDLANGEWNKWQIIAEAVVSAVCEHRLGFSHDHAVLAEALIADDAVSNLFSLPRGIMSQVEHSHIDRMQIIEERQQPALKHLLLGIDCETQWDLLPYNIRLLLLKRCRGLSRPLSAEESEWVQNDLCTSSDITATDLVARSNLAAVMSAATYQHAQGIDDQSSYDSDDQSSTHTNDILLSEYEPLSEAKPASMLGKCKLSLVHLLQDVQACIKFTVLSLTADLEYQRELNHVLRGKPAAIRWPATFVLNAVWSFCKSLQSLVLPLVLFSRHEHVAQLNNNLQGLKTKIHKNRIVIESLNGPSTCFWKSEDNGDLRLCQYAGRVDAEPTDFKTLVAINDYTGSLVLLRREEFKNGKAVNAFKYEYALNSSSKLPIQRECIKGELENQICHYDHRGYVVSGSMFKGVNTVKFDYWYRKSARFEDELLWAEYSMSHIRIKVLWSMPPRDHSRKLEHWIPFATVTEATFIEDNGNTYHASWDYEHKFHPDISCTLNGVACETPAMISEDWFKVLTKPERCGFLNENPLLAFSSVKTSFASRALGLNVKHYPIRTSHARATLWKAWKNGKQLDAVTTRWLDERLLRKDTILRPYWRRRDWGLLDSAKKYLDAQADTIMAKVDVDPDTSSWTHIAYKISDLYSFGQGGDSRINTRTLDSQMKDNIHELHVLAMDTSTWPNEPGGVSACRRDMVNDLNTIKWHVLAESANDYGVPRFQIEKNVQSLTILPLWGLDFLNPTHGVLEGSLDSAIVQRSYDTKDADIVKNFLPILTSLVKCARSIQITKEHIEESTRALCDLNTYFESTRSWNDVWSSDIVKEKWRELWLSEQDNTFNVSQWLDYEKPTLTQMDTALDLWHRYLFIFSIPLPEEIPDVFQASHHFTGATYGILCKVKRNCTLHVWDHCISYREFTTFMASAVSYDTPFINSSLISLTHLACNLLEHHADVVLPCCDYYNPGWEVELGTAEGVLEHRRTFARKIDPVVNGIANMEKFEPVKEIKTAKPTVVLLSHVQYVKDIKCTIMAADYIVNKWGFKDYSVHVYGDTERAATITTECQELIASKGLQEHCILKGLGNPSVVLQDAWIFLNSSISEGLPLAMGEAALTGTPVVCTDVGASFCVVTDRKTGNRFSEVVPPNDPESLARAQINVMALTGRWAEFAEDAPGFQAPTLSYPLPTPEEVTQIEARMYEKQEQRRALGMFGRQNVLKSFSAERYLREHEQMLWIGKYRAPSNTSFSSSRPESLRSGVWFNGVPSNMPVAEKKHLSHRHSRLTPESWVSLSSTRVASTTSLRSTMKWWKQGYELRVVDPSSPRTTTISSRTSPHYTPNTLSVAPSVENMKSVVTRPAASFVAPKIISPVSSLYFRENRPMQAC